MSTLATITERLAAGEVDEAVRLLADLEAQSGRLRAVAEQMRSDAAAALARASAAGATPASFVDLARGWRSAGYAAMAGAAVEIALALQPRHGAALVLWGELARDRGDRAAARARFAAAAEADPRSFWAHLHLSEEHRCAGSLAEAEAAAEAALRISPGNAQALVSLGMAARAAGNRARAVARFRAAREADPANRWGWLNLAEELRSAGAAEEAEAVLHEMLARFPNDGQALIGLGLGARARRDLAAARDLFVRATAVAARDGWGWFHLAQAEFDLGDPAAAEAAGRRAEALMPNNGAVLLLLADCAERRGAREEALGLLQRATRHDPDNAWTWIGLARLHQDARAWDAARDTLRACLARNPSQVHALLALARVEEAAGATEAADAALAAAAAADPTSAAPLVAQAKLAQRRGDVSAAGALAARARQLAPQDPGPVEILAELARKAMDVEAAAALYREASALAPGRPWAHVGLAQLRLGEGDLAGALSAVEEAEAGQGLSAELAAMRTELLRRAGEWPRALRTARETAARWTDPWLQEQRVLIELCHAGPAAAAAALAELVRDNPSQQARHAHLAGLVEEAGWQIDAAHDHYRRALELEPRREAALNDALRVALLRCDLAEALRHLDSLARLDAARRYRASHTLLGNLANEYALDRPLLDALFALRRTAPGERIPALHALVRDHPDATGPALQLLLALREAGPLGLRAPSAAGPIPRRICQYWPTPELPPDIAGYMASWERSHPGWPIQRFDDIRAHAWLRERFPPALMTAFRSARTPGMRADLIRLAWLKAEGGFGAEAASRCLVPDTLGGAKGIVPAGADLVLAFEETGAPGNGLIGAVPGHPLIDDALSRAVAGINRGDNDGGWLMTGPGLLARALASAIAEAGGPLPGCHLLDRQELGRVVATQCHSPHGTGGPPARRRRPPPPPG